MNYHCIEGYAFVKKIMLALEQRKKVIIFSIHDKKKWWSHHSTRIKCMVWFYLWSFENAKFITSYSEKDFRQLSDNGQGGDKNLNEMFGLTEMINKTINNLDLTLSKMSKSFQSCVCRFVKRKVYGRHEWIPGF